MKQFLALLTSLLFCTFPMSATTFVPDGDEGDPEEIDLRNQHFGGKLSSFQNWINGSGVIVLNSSSLPFGIYTLNIMTNQLYQGVFTI